MAPPGDSAEFVVRAAFAEQADWCRKLGSPFTALLCDVLAERIDRTTKVGRRLLDWPQTGHLADDAVPLRIAGGLNALVRGGRLPDLARHYPPHPLPDADALWRAVDAALREADTDLLPWLDSAPQTNEVARSAVLMAGLLAITKITGQPLALYELGASAGLNLVLDRYAYRLGGTRVGPPEAGLVLAPLWSGRDPPGSAIRVVSRQGVDLNPLDIAQRADRERLLAYVWPDQRERVARVDAALAIAAIDPPDLTRADAAGWLEQRITPGGPAGVTRVVLHSIAFQYFPAETADRIAARMESAGGAARDEAPLAWLRFERDEALGRFTLRLKLWPGGTDRLLAYAHPHGRDVEWVV